MLLRLFSRKSSPAPAARRKRRWLALLRFVLTLVMLALALEAGYILLLLPDWDAFQRGPIQKSRFMQVYESEQRQHTGWPRLQWYPVNIARIPRHLVRAVVVAEDSRFYEHQGFDQEALLEAMEFNISKGKIVYGASTISQQTIKNYLLTSDRTPLRKLHEVILTYIMEQKISKRRIMEIYLNVAEFGRGIYGVEAAARHYWGKSVDELSMDEAIDLAATLPGPVKHNPETRSRFFVRHRETIRRHIFGNEETEVLSD